MCVCVCVWGGGGGGSMVDKQCLRVRVNVALFGQLSLVFLLSNLYVDDERDKSH